LREDGIGDGEVFEGSVVPATSPSSPAVRGNPHARPALTEPNGWANLAFSEADEGGDMQLYAILRRRGWRSPEDLEAAAERSRQVGDEEMSGDIRWIRSYVLEEGQGSVGTVCVYEATSPEAIREHASRADLPFDEIIPIAETVVVREDPQPAAS
jgi:Protein of unknown function (DUF4242)